MQIRNEVKDDSGLYYKHRDGWKKANRSMVFKEMWHICKWFKDRNSKLEIMGKYSILHKWMFNTLEMNIFILQLIPKNWDSLERHSQGTIFFFLFFWREKSYFPLSLLIQEEAWQTKCNTNFLIDLPGEGYQYGF